MFDWMLSLRCPDESGFDVSGLQGKNISLAHPIAWRLNPPMAEGDLQRILESAQESWRRFDFQKCVELMERALRLAPGHSGILLDLGTYHLKARNYAAAEECFENAIRADTEKT